MDLLIIGCTIIVCTIIVINNLDPIDESEDCDAFKTRGIINQEPINMEEMFSTCSTSSQYVGTWDVPDHDRTAFIHDLSGWNVPDHDSIQIGDIRRLTAGADYVYTFEGWKKINMPELPCPWLELTFYGRNRANKYVPVLVAKGCFKSKHEAAELLVDFDIELPIAFYEYGKAMARVDVTQESKALAGTLSERIIKDEFVNGVRTVTFKTIDHGYSTMNGVYHVEY